MLRRSRGRSKVTCCRGWCGTPRPARFIGTTRYHDIVAAIDRVEIGYTWYAQSRQRSNVNTTCKLLLLQHAFDTVGCKVVGLRTDNFNFRSQRAIEGIGAKRDGVLRHHAARKDGTVRDSVMYSILAAEWPDVRRHLELRLARQSEQNELKKPQRTPSTQSSAQRTIRSARKTDEGEQTAEDAEHGELAQRTIRSAWTVNNA